MFVEGIEILEL